MGKRVNLAALAQDDFYEPSPPPAQLDPPPAPAASGASPVTTAEQPRKPETPLAAPTRLRAAEPVVEVATTEPSGTRTVALSTLTTNPLNKRHPGDDDQLLEMAETIRQHGVIQPLVVCSAEAYLAAFPEQRSAIGEAQWVTLIGNRRLGAARLVPLDEVAIVVND